MDEALDDVASPLAACVAEMDVSDIDCDYVSEVMNDNARNNLIHGGFNDDIDVDIYDDDDNDDDDDGNDVSINDRSSCYDPYSHLQQWQRPPAVSFHSDMVAIENRFSLLSDSDKLRALTRLATQVDHLVPGLSKMCGPRVDFISCLPPELGVHILTYFSAAELLIACQVCHHWHRLATDNLPWRAACIRKDWEPTSSEQRIFDDSSIATPLPPSLWWKSFFKRRYRIEGNWRKGWHRKYLLSGHSLGVYCSQIEGDRLLSGSKDRTVKVWDLRTGKCTKTLKEHKGSVLCLWFRGNTLVTGSSDNTVKLWDLEAGTVIREIEGHKDPVLNLRFDDKRLVTCSKDFSVRVWTMPDTKCLHVLEGHTATVNTIQFDDHHLVSASGDRSIMIWSMKSGELLRTLKGHQGGVACLQLRGDTIVSGSSDKTLCVWDVLTGRLRHTLYGHLDLVRNIHLAGNRIVSGSYDGKVRVWNARTGECMVLLNSDSDQSAVFKVEATPTFLLVGRSSGEIWIYDFDCHGCGDPPCPFMGAWGSPAKDEGGATRIEGGPTGFNDGTSQVNNNSGSSSSSIGNPHGAERMDGMYDMTGNALVNGNSLLLTDH